MTRDHIYKPRSVPAPKRIRRVRHVSAYINEDDYQKVKELAGSRPVSEYLRILIRDNIHKHYGTMSKEIE